MKQYFRAADANMLGYGIVVTFNGIELEDIYEAEIDSETGAGWIKRFKRDRDRKEILFDWNTRQPATETIALARGLKLVSKGKQR